MKKLLLVLSIALLTIVSLPALTMAEYGGDGNGGQVEKPMCIAAVGEMRCHADAAPNSSYCSSHQDWAAHELDWFWLMWHIFV